MLTHIVFFKLLDPSPDNLQKAKEVLLGMEGKIPQLNEKARQPAGSKFS